MSFSFGFSSPLHSTLWANSEVIREELFGPERLAQHGHTLAEAQPVSPRKGGGRELSKRLRQNADALLEAYRAIALAVENGATITPSPYRPLVVPASTE